MKLMRKAVILVAAAMNGIALAETDTAVKGSLLIFPAVEVRWGPDGNLVQDTFLEICNDYPSYVHVMLFFVQGDPPLPYDPETGEREHLGWNWIDHIVELTADQPVYWSAFTGLPVGFVPWEVLDPGEPLGRPAMDGTSDRVLRGCIYAWAVHPVLWEPIRWNHLSGGAVVLNYHDGTTWEYDAMAFQVVDPEVGNGELVGTPEELNLDDEDYSAPPAELLLKFQAVGASNFSDAGKTVVSSTDLTLLPVTIDFRQWGQGPVATEAHFDIWNMNETKFTGCCRCVTFWDQTLLAYYDSPNYWWAATLQTDHGMARIDGIHSNQCEGSEPVPLLGVAAKQIIFLSDVSEFSQSGSNLIGIGQEDALVRYETPDPPAEGAPERRGRAGAMADRGGRDTTPRVNASVEGSLLVFPKIDVQWLGDGSQLMQNAFIELANDSDEPVTVRLYFVNGDEPMPSDGIERPHRGWNTITTDLTLTPHQPMYWSALTGEPAGVPPWEQLDPGDPPGRPNPEGSWSRVLRGSIYAWAINDEGEEIRHDHLSGRVTTVYYFANYAWEHEAFAFRVADPDIAPGEPTGTPGVLHLDGEEYAAAFDMLLMNFQAVNSYAYSSPFNYNVYSDTDLTLLTAERDLRFPTSEPPHTKAEFDIWNEWEMRFSGTFRCITAWDQTMLSNYDAPNFFFKELLQTNQGRARIDGVQGDTHCPGSQDAALLGVAARRLSFTDLDLYDMAGSDLVGMGLEEAEVSALPHVECIVDQYQAGASVYLAGFAQTGLAQSFTPDRDDIGGAGIFLQPGIGSLDVVTIELWDALPNAGGERLASATTLGWAGTWANVTWPPVPVTPGTTYYLVFTGNTTLGIAGNPYDPYPGGHVFANPGYQPYPDYDYAFWTCYVPEDGFKHEQMLACDEPLGFSNYNSWYETWMRYDDFTCTQTGDITHVTLWGGGYDVLAGEPCDLLSNLAGLIIDMYEWEQGGPCEWHAGDPICSTYVPLADLHPVGICDNPNGIHVYRLNADLPELCHQEQGGHYVIRILAYLFHPEAGCIFAWASTDEIVGEAGFAALPSGECIPNVVDPAFVLLTEVSTHPADFDGDGDVDTADLLHLLGAWGTPDGDVDGDGDTDTADLLALLGAWGPYR